MLTLFQTELWSCRFSLVLLKAVETSIIWYPGLVRVPGRWLSPSSGSHRATFRYPLMAEVASSSCPLLQYIKILYSSHGKNIYKVLATYNMYRIESISRISKNRNNFPFSYLHREKQRCWKMIEHLWDIVEIYIQKKTASNYWLQDKLTLNPSPSHQVHAQKWQEPKALHSFGVGPPAPF